MAHGQAEPTASLVTALLGSTNTGKTHRAIERLLEHDTAIMGLPLRLLAREVYDRITTRVGEDAVALVTGEEKRVPARARYWICTVEAMPLDLEVDFVAVDEIQLATHRTRGHVFTDRLLFARGRLETWFLGADTMQPLLERLLPTARVMRHPRLSRLRYRGRSSLAGLPPRSAVVAFNVARVYELADALRRRRGGAAVVLGALSPRARNAQVALYESGDVDYLVATDAIGMGLNLDVDHVALAALRKFDGNEERELEAAEMAQIVGRAGRYLRDGTFGVLAPLGELPPALVRNLEEHRFPRIGQVYYRNSDVDTSNLSSLIGSLRKAPNRPWLRAVRHAEDLDALVRLGEDDAIRRLADGPERVALLWEVCQIPDFRKLLPESHARLLGEIFSELVHRGRLGDAFLQERFDALDAVDGDIDALTARIAAVRTWSYVSERRGWVERGQLWRERAHDVEDRLSDALHDRLVQRFVERRGHAARIQRRGGTGQNRRGSGPSEVDADSPFSKLLQLDLRLAPGDGPADRVTWLEELVDDHFDAFTLHEDGAISYREHRIARLSRGQGLLRPEVTLTLEDAISGSIRVRVARRVRALCRDVVTRTLGPLPRSTHPGLSAAGRGLVYQLEQGLGSVERREAAEQVRVLSIHDRELLHAAGVIMGRRVLYTSPSISREGLRRRKAFCAAYHGSHAVDALPTTQRGSFTCPRGIGDKLLLDLGFVLAGDRAVRADVLESVLAELERASESAPFGLPESVPRELEATRAEAAFVVRALGFVEDASGRFARARAKRRRRRKRGARGKPARNVAHAPASRSDD